LHKACSVVTKHIIVPFVAINCGWWNFSDTKYSKTCNSTGYKK